MNFPGNVDNGPRKRWLHFGDVPDSGRILTFDQSSEGFDHKGNLLWSVSLLDSCLYLLQVLVNENSWRWPEMSERCSSLRVISLRSGSAEICQKATDVSHKLNNQQMF